MKASKFSEAQKAFILKQGAEGVPVADICRKAGISQGDLFQPAEEIRRHVAARDAASAACQREGTWFSPPEGPFGPPVHVSCGSVPACILALSASRIAFNRSLSAWAAALSAFFFARFAATNSGEFLRACSRRRASLTALASSI